MKLICINSDKFFYEDIIHSLDILNNDIVIVPPPPEDEGLKEQYLEELSALTNDFNPDAFFSVDHYPFISLFCTISSIDYICWLISSYSQDFFDTSLHCEHTHCFCADESLCNELRSNGIDSHYIPFGVPDTAPADTSSEYTSSLNLWGSIVTKETIQSVSKSFLGTLLDSTEGYIDGTVACKSQLSYTDFTNVKLPTYVIDDLISAFLHPNKDYYESNMHYIINNYLNPLVNISERKISFAKFFDQDRFDKINHYNIGNDFFEFEKYTIISTILSRSELTKEITKAPINIVLPNRNRHSSISPIVWYIMWTGSFFITSKRKEFELINCTESLQFINSFEMLSKSAYYSAHDKERKLISDNISSSLENHTFSKRLTEILNF